MEHTNEGSYPRPKYAWYTVILLLIVYTFSFIDRQILGLLGPMIIAEFDLNDTEFALLSGLAFAIFYTFFGLFFSRIADSKSRRGLIAFGLVVWSLMTAASSLARSYSQLFLLRIGVGVGEATLAPAANSIIADSFPKEKLGTALSVYSMGIPIGIGVASVVGGAMIGLAGSIPDISIFGSDINRTWQKAFMLVGLPGLLLTVFVITLKEPSRKGVDPAIQRIAIRDVFTFLGTKWQAYVSISIGMSLISMLGFGTAIFLPTFFERVHAVPPSQMGQIFGWIAVATGPVGLIIGGMVADRWMRAGIKDAYPRALMVAPLGFCFPAILFPFLDYSPLLWAVIGASNLFLSMPAGIAFASLQIITPNRMRGQVVALYVLSTNLFGYALGPLLIGVFSDYLFEGDFSIGYAMALVGALTIPSCLALFQWGRRYYAKALVEEEARLNSAANSV